MLKLLLVALVLAACESPPKRELDLERIEIKGANMRTDLVGEGKFETSATFVLVDARNLASEGAYVTLGGELVDAAGADIGTLLLQSLWIPPGETRTFALVDSERKPRPTAKTARAKVKGAIILPAPLVRVEELHTFPNHGELVVQAYLVNDADMAGTVVVIGVFHDDQGRPLVRPHNILKIGAKQEPITPGNCPDAGETKLALASKCPVRFIGPKGAVRGTIFVGETQY